MVKKEKVSVQYILIKLKESGLHNIMNTIYKKARHKEKQKVLKLKKTLENI